MGRFEVGRTIGLLCALALIAGTQAARAQDKAGVTAAVNPAVTGTPPADLPRVLEIGSDVVQNEHITAGPDGQAQLLFRDGSTVTLAPNSDLTIDEFVYNPETKTAKLAMTAAVGVFRFVGGRASKDEPVIINTPTATVGIRGAVAAGGVDANGTTDFTKFFGAELSMTSKATGETTSTSKNGFTLTIVPNGSITVTRVDLARLNARFGAFEGRSDKNGGAATPPNQTSPAALIFAGSNSALSPQSLIPTGPLPIVTPITSIMNNANQFTTQTAQTIASGGSGLLPAGSYAYGLAAGGQYPYAFASSPFATTTVVSMGNSITTSDITNLTFNGQGVPVQITEQFSYTLQINGSPPSSSSYSYSYGFANIAVVQPLSGDSVVKFGSFTGQLSADGSVYGPSTVTHYIYGVPATLLPVSGQYSFSLLGATSPTFTNGIGASGTFAGSLSVLFGNFSGINGFVVGINATVSMPGDGVYQLSTIGGLSNPAQQLMNLGSIGTISGGGLNGSGNGLFYGTPNTSGTGRTCSGSGCTSTVYGFLAGAGASHAGITYLIIPNNCSGGSCGIPGIQGVAAFHR